MLTYRKSSSVNLPKILQFCFLVTSIFDVPKRSTKFNFNLNEKKNHNSRRLLTVDESILNKMPTIVKMRALFDNYVLDSSAREVVTANERAENTDFLNEILKTPIMTAAMKFLQKKGSFYIINSFLFIGIAIGSPNRTLY